MLLFDIWGKYVWIEILVVQNLQLVFSKTELAVLKRSGCAAGNGKCHQRRCGYIQKEPFHFYKNTNLS